MTRNTLTLGAALILAAAPAINAQQPPADGVLVARYGEMWRELAAVVSTAPEDCSALSRSVQGWHDRRWAALDTLYSMSEGLTNRLTEDLVAPVEASRELLITALERPARSCSRNSDYRAVVMLIERLMRFGGNP